ncbi:ABC transporter permease [Mycobacterium sp. E2733]|uniref:ABC transporter permease n=1 Tax=Mycobacterium sp. E2733 TaxID=1834138 RepID=UPI0009EDF219|nr:ABC transporter permease [Mycobacterium sp. E2733]
MPRHRIQGSLIVESWVQAGRLLTEWRRERAVLVGSLIIPVSLLLVYVVVLDERVHKITGVQSVYSLVPVCAVLAGLFGALSTSLGIAMDRDSGLLSRMWVLPVHRASALTGRLTAEAVRALIGTILITGIGVAMGLRFSHGWATVLVYVLIPPIVVVGFAALIMAFAIRTNGVALMTWLAAGTVALAFLNPGTTPIMLYPDWLRPFVRIQPMSPPIEAMLGLAHGGPLLWPLALTFAWALVLFAIFIPVAVRGYRSAAESSA